MQIFKTIFKLISSPITLTVIALLILTVYILRRGTNFLSIGKVLSDYLAVFKDAKWHLAVFWGVPVLFGLSLMQVSPITESTADNLLVFLSILISAFFAMLSILVSCQGNNHGRLYQQVLKESASIVLLEIVLCILAIVITLTALISEGNITEAWQRILAFMDYYFIFVMLLNTLILIKRIKALIDNVE